VTLQELIAHVESHPEDSERRWRLVKKLYMSSEYRQALTHLQILVQGKDPNLNILRYLAATHYRLGQYEESIRVLKSALPLWPDETPLHMQLARVMEVAGRRAEAAKAWEGILRLDPASSMAQQAVMRLRSPRPDSSGGEQAIAESDSGIDLNQSLICAECGVQNPPDQKSCWQCGAALRYARPVTPAPFQAEEMKRRHTLRWLWISAGSLLVVVFVVVGACLVTNAFLRAGDPGHVALSLRETISMGLVWPRVVIGSVLLFAWPALLLGVTRMLGGNRCPASVPLVEGALLASATHLLLWAPVHLLPFALLLPLMGSLALIATTTRMRFGQVLAAWAIQAAVVAGLAAGLLTLVEGRDFLEELPAVMSAASLEEAGGSPEPLVIEYPSYPVNVQLWWEPSGVAWIDRQPLTVRIEARATPVAPPQIIELREGTEVRFQDYPQVPQSGVASFTHRVEPGRMYSVYVDAQGDSPVSLVVEGAIRPSRP
jgi:ribosomal protein L40E